MGVKKCHSDDRREEDELLRTCPKKSREHKAMKTLVEVLEILHYTPFRSG